MPASRGEGDGCHGDAGRRGGRVRARWRGAGGQLSSPHMRVGVAEITRWPPSRVYQEPLKMVRQLLGGDVGNLRKQVPKWVCLGRPRELVGPERL